MTRKSNKTKLCTGLEISASLLRAVLLHHIKAQKCSHLQSFLRNGDVFHNLFQLFSKRCECVCGWQVPFKNRKRRALDVHQWDLLYVRDISTSQVHGYKPNPDLKLEHLDITLLVNILYHNVLFRFDYLEKLARKQKYASVEDLIKTSQHYLWSAWKPKEKCKCGTILAGHSQNGTLLSTQWDSLFKRDHTLCNFSVREPISPADVDGATIETILRCNPQKCTELIHIENIHRIRNRVYHSGDKWELNDFKTIWSELKSSTLVLAGYTSIELEVVCTRKFEEEEETCFTPEEAYTVLSSRRTDDGVPLKVKNKMESSQKEIEQHTSRYDTFVSTEVYESALRLVKEKRFVVLKGNAGEGKSSLAYQIAWKCLKDTECIYNVLIIRSASDWSRYVSSWNCENTLLVLDDFLGKYADSESEIEIAEWRKLINSVSSALTTNSCILVVSEYTYRVYKNAFEMDILPAFSNEWEIKDMTLTKKERLQILKSYNQDLSSNIDLLDNIVEKFSCFGFPKCCVLFSRESTKEEYTFLDITKKFLNEEVCQLPPKVKSFIQWLKKCHGQAIKNSIASAFKEENIDNMLHVCESIFIFQSNNSIELIAALRTSLPRELSLLERFKQFLQFLYNEFVRLFSR